MMYDIYIYIDLNGDEIENIYNRAISFRRF